MLKKIKLSFLFLVVGLFNVCPVMACSNPGDAGKPCMMPDGKTAGTCNATSNCVPNPAKK